MVLAIGGDKADRHAAGPGPAGAADAVDVVDRGARQVVVDDRRQGLDVDAAGGQIGGDQHAQAAAAEVGQHLAAGALAEIADAGAVELVGHMLGGIARTHKHQHALPAVGAQQMAQQRGAAHFIDGDGALFDLRGCHRRGGDLDAQRVMQQPVSQAAHFRRESGREQQGLALLR